MRREPSPLYEHYLDRGPVLPCGYRTLIARTFRLGRSWGLRWRHHPRWVEDNEFELGSGWYGGTRVRLRLRVYGNMLCTPCMDVYIGSEHWLFVDIEKGPNMNLLV
jgi:hypothetical protein